VRELNKISPSLEWEIKRGFPDFPIAGVDEVGRGCLAGPVVAGAVILPPKALEDFRTACGADTVAQPNNEHFFWIKEIKDSKLLSAEKREELVPKIKNWVSAYSIGVASVEEIDRLNIHHAVHLAMCRAIEGLSKRGESILSNPVLPKHILIDGNFIPKGLSAPATAIVKGDQKSLSIAAASLIAKVWRDHFMVQLDNEHPGYGLSVHKGYPTARHRAALLSQGVSSIHRKSFAPVQILLTAQSLIAF
jgi:ribonuclease HII